jgi:hypothetical protein
MMRQSWMQKCAYRVCGNGNTADETEFNPGNMSMGKRLAMRWPSEAANRAYLRWQIMYA